MAQPTQLTQSEFDFVMEQRKLSPFARIKAYLKKVFIHAFLALLITCIGLWFLVAFTDFKLPFLYSENKVEYHQGKCIGAQVINCSDGVTRTVRKKVIINLNPTIRKDGIVIKEGKK